MSGHTHCRLMLSKQTILLWDVTFLLLRCGNTPSLVVLCHGKITRVLNSSYNQCPAPYNHRFATVLRYDRSCLLYLVTILFCCLLKSYPCYGSFLWLQAALYAWTKLGLLWFRMTLHCKPRPLLFTQQAEFLHEKLIRSFVPHHAISPSHCLTLERFKLSPDLESL